MPAHPLYPKIDGGCYGGALMVGWWDVQERPFLEVLH
jgi:hypothetical protein